MSLTAVSVHLTVPALTACSHLSCVAEAGLAVTLLITVPWNDIHRRNEKMVLRVPLF
ncbi:Uncharacterized protein dnm_026210 [Desulfonema magnum]|uniref:Uncharacterized protein n=1 Tax=Desulfonema magnum TaxID=45655 RepID=A0A975BJV0_9BACT|nr:Uncharacterized protein dnm_026210 [Desulfonema magnum]